MKKLIYVLFIILFVACSKDNGITSNDVIVTGAANVSEQTATVCGYLNVEATVRNTCQFGFLYSTNQNPSKDNGIFINSFELDANNRFEVTVEHLAPYTEYFYTAFLKYETGSYQYGKTLSFKTDIMSIPEGAVDLGLSVLWASCNLGASSPEDYGDYYQWAGTQDVSSKSINLGYGNCPYHTGLIGDTGWTKYVPYDKSSYWSGMGSPDNKTILSSEDDAAHVKLGGKWRMPTEIEWTELIDNCTMVQTIQNGVSGYKMTSKKDGFTDKSIFLPIAGYRVRDGLLNEGYCGYYWSLSLHSNYPYYAYYACFGVEGASLRYIERYYGQSIRPVFE